MRGWWSRLPIVAYPHLRPAALRLGYAAALPFVVGAAAVLLARGGMKDHAAAALGACAATVVSFRGGIHWGFGFRTTQPPSSMFMWGVVPALMNRTPSTITNPRAGRAQLIRRQFRRLLTRSGSACGGRRDPQVRRLVLCRADVVSPDESLFAQTEPRTRLHWTSEGITCACSAGRMRLD